LITFNFKFVNNAAGRLTYGAVPAVDANVWNASLSTDGIPHDEDTLWKMAEPDHMAGRVNYTSGSLWEDAVVLFCVVALQALAGAIFSRQRR